MSTPNESIIAIPMDVADPAELRKFLVNLILKLDELFGFRGDDPAVTSDGIAVTSDGIIAFVDESIAALKYPAAIESILVQTSM